jgi:hypothetical protein
MLESGNPVPIWDGPYGAQAGPVAAIRKWMRRINDPILRLIGNLRQDRRNPDQLTEFGVAMTMRDAIPQALRSLGFNRMVAISARRFAPT